MPRNKISQNKNVTPAIREIESFIEKNGININKLANICGVDQGALYRFYKGERKTITKVAEEVLCHIRVTSDVNYVNKSDATLDLVDMDSIILERVKRLYARQPERFNVLVDCLSVLEAAFNVAIEAKIDRDRGKQSD